MTQHPLPNGTAYDTWGNLLSKSVTKCSAENLSVTSLPNNQLSGYGYDAAGNMTSDPTDSVSATYDAENRIATVTKNGVTTTYTYDADGNRVEKSNGTTATLYWYMSPGIVAESDLSGNLQSEYVFFDGERLARKDFPGNAVSYYFSDHLKTTDIVTDAQGNIKNESDFYPWGGELQFLASDSNHYKFTGKERDAETGLDYFGARYYSNGLGRFIIPDWNAVPVPIPFVDRTDPQTLNLYSYVRNLSTTHWDVDGHSDYTAQKVMNDALGRGWRTNAEVRGSSVSQTAQSHVGSRMWDIKGTNVSGNQVFKPGQDKCNQFVRDNVREAGKETPSVPNGKGRTRMPTAHELGDPTVHINGLCDAKPLSDAKPGDVIAQMHGDTEGHAGIVVQTPGADGTPGQTVSANANVGGTVTQNDWGFRDPNAAVNNGERNGSSSPPPVVRTPIDRKRPESN